MGIPFFFNPSLDKEMVTKNLRNTGILLELFATFLNGFWEAIEKI